MVMCQNQLQKNNLRKSNEEKEKQEMILICVSSTNGTYEIGQTDSTSTDQTKSSSVEVNQLNCIEFHSFFQIDLATFLIQRACEKPKIASYLFWYIP